MSPTEYLKLTDIERIFIRKAHENKFISDITWTRNAVLNAEANANRGKNKRFIELFPKTQKADIEYNESAIATIHEIEETNGKSWVERVYQANGTKKPITEERSN